MRTCPGGQLLSLRSRSSRGKKRIKRQTQKRRSHGVGWGQVLVANMFSSLPSKLQKRTVDFQRRSEHPLVQRQELWRLKEAGAVPKLVILGVCNSLKHEKRRDKPTEG